MKSPIALSAATTCARCTLRLAARYGRFERRNPVLFAGCANVAGFNHAEAQRSRRRLSSSRRSPPDDVGVCPASLNGERQQNLQQKQAFTILLCREESVLRFLCALRFSALFVFLLPLGTTIIAVDQRASRRSSVFTRRHTIGMPAMLRG